MVPELVKSNNATGGQGKNPKHGSESEESEKQVVEQVLFVKSSVAET